MFNYLITQSFVVDSRYQATLPTVGNDPLDDFMTLRMNMVSSSIRQPGK